jgi:hypothetical protein
MTLLNGKNLPVLGIIAVLFFVIIFAIQPVGAVKVEGAKIMLDVVPGTTYIFPMAISTKPDDSASDYAVDLLGFGQSIDGGSYTPLAVTDDTGPYSARSFISVPSPVIHLDPGQRREFSATIKIPQTVGEGGRYALVYIHPAAAAGEQTSFATAIIVPVMLTVKDTTLTETGTITDVKVSEITEGKPVTIRTVLQNTGNHHYYGVVNRITITDAGGRIVATTTTSPAAHAVIPGQSIGLDATVNKPLPAGTYTLMSEVTLESGAVIGTRTLSYTVKQAYIPPFQGSSITISPDAPALLNVPEGTVVLNFPRGAVLSETTISVKPYTENLPEPPAGAIAGSTAFSVDGLSGLLAQDATVTVRYSSADLAAANGDASKLVLGRYDRVEGHWTLLPTSVDTASATLTATTNRFSIWAVLAKQGTASGPAPTQSPGSAPILICGLIVFVLLVRNAAK